MGTIFVGGVHGVGKTDVCRRVAERMSLAHFTASALIQTLDSSAVKEHTKSVESVPKNQDLLVQAVTQYFASGKDRLLLDGHFAIPNMASQFEMVEVDVFKRIQLDGVILCADNPLGIHARRMARDNKSLGVPEIEHIQRRESKHAARVAECLSVPFIHLNPKDANDMAQFVCQVWNINFPSPII